MLAHGSERAVGPHPVGPDHSIRRLRQGVATDDSKAKPLFHLKLTGLRRCRACVTEAKRRIGIVFAHGLAHQDLEHRTDRVELRGVVPPGRG